ncbi:hypothetical protein HO173_009436 [Letharia columbiana]|uniref:Uncharacterized protein n=1 Tax=Letharia columbiana TaxID=112416 RepID=A0A8H6FPI3_9LECA|nr:uncharacterized protein HO173_009436 [Letharia columbiana]KAF6232331.1 hypothetical protein HO173_009436 [Letharia columbiana]
MIPLFWQALVKLIGGKRVNDSSSLDTVHLFKAFVDNHYPYFTHKERRGLFTATNVDHFEYRSFYVALLVLSHRLGSQREPNEWSIDAAAAKLTVGIGACAMAKADHCDRVALS